jgi:hypothetical protein
LAGIGNPSLKYVHKIFVPWRDGFGAGQIGHDATTAPLTPSPRRPVRLARALFFHRHGEIRDRTFENQHYRASGLNLTIAAIILWNTVYLGHAVAELRAQGETLPDTLLAHIAPLGWEHISFNGDYVWPSEPFKDGFRPLRNPRFEFLDAA